MHIDSYKIYSYGTTWKNGKAEVEHIWHGDYGSKDCHVEVTFKNRER
jgi:hypothetical protein